MMPRGQAPQPKGRFDRAAMREDLQQRTKESFDRKDDSGLFKTIFDPSLEVPMWKCGDGKHTLDIIPFRAGKNNPNVPEGKTAYVLDVWVHYRIGPTDDAFICPLRTWKEPCPICEYRKQLYDAGTADEKTLKDLAPKRRNIYNVVVYDTPKEEEKGVQVWDVAHFFMEKNLLPLAEKPRGGGVITYSDADEGRQIVFTRKGTGPDNTQFFGHQLVERDYVVSDEILEQAFVLDDLVIWPTYEELNEVFWKGKGEQAPEPHRGSRTSNEPPPEPPSEDTRRPVRQPAGRGSSSAPSGTQECPSGAVFGKDIDRLQACLRCDIYELCEKAAQASGKENEPPPTRGRTAGPALRTRSR